MLSRLIAVSLSALLFLTFLLHLRIPGSWLLQKAPAKVTQSRKHTAFDDPKIDWARRPQKYPSSKVYSLPRPALTHLPRIQFDFSNQTESAAEAATRRQRLAQVKGALKRSWQAYQLKAWMKDELAPVSGSHKTTFGGWAATLVDTLDTLWIAGLRDEFYEAVDAAMEIDFSNSAMREINVFETTIRYLGGFIAAYDLSGDKRLLQKAVELAHLLYASFDTPNRLPVLRWNFRHAQHHLGQTATKPVLLAEIGSLSLEFTRLSQITNDPRWYDAIHRIMALFEQEQHKTALPGMWPVEVNAEDADFHTGYLFSLAAWADSMYEYLPKMYALLGGSDQYARMWESAADTAIKYSLYRPLIRENITVLMAGTVMVEGDNVSLQPELQHLVCYAGGMFALGGRLLGNQSHVDIGRKLTDGCAWAYEKTETGIMPETSNLIPCAIGEPCKWDSEKWHAAVLEDASPEDKEAGLSAGEIIEAQHLPHGFSAITNPSYRLRPEAIESVFILYRITGNKTLQDTAWNMFRSIHAHTRTDLAHAALTDVRNTTAPREDTMESFWTAETLKYFYLTFAEPDHISLDEYVFNTEAHPFRLRTAASRKSGLRWQWKAG
ncbi:seven-hairpin glycosidase [Lecanosticta acicola]|uniref:alpha-1,2-Mannosidase n=1 Tax=Lecanosticta acicola TaxID=111012 RepID=A0AAI8YT94_9PEZI|nr:seven-hairpin glycosidase [Lecanosticta acicola]